MSTMAHLPELGDTNSWHVRSSFLSNNWMMATGSIRRGFRWELDGLADALRRPMRTSCRATKNSTGSAISDMPGVVPAYPRIALLMRFDFRLRATAEIESSSLACSN